ncbi:L-2-hydroxyglutarate oxidase [Francisella sp. 19X1-34]|uniref:L-2-hydroxyglutarate oxidase n=1 Tax=Francisella sp. 19X1-34 TaxID=3087177 RepID=UPI002E316A6C|nr:L-2-hydroxyglutarate oxidase [Francisella sp. 19X1-34]MED7787558.1 L-2-hydroxyglutarate oxidase [Francisella sp. 19X1-34]
MSDNMYDYVIVGAGIVGMTIAYELLQRGNDSIRILIVEKESDVAFHASGRNSGVLHAGFYYSADSLKAKLTVEGNRLMKEFCKSHGIHVNKTGKLVVASNLQELDGLKELKRRGDVNGVELELITEKEAQLIEPNIRTYKYALWSPNTASVNPKKVCMTLRDELISKGVVFAFNTDFLKSNYSYKFLVNAAGLYADKVAKRFGLAKEYTLLPFKGRYAKYTGIKNFVKTNIYPVPNLKNPFLGVHYTVTNTDEIKIGPTATPVFWREGYSLFKKFKLREFAEISYYILKLFVKNKFGFRELAFEELKNYNRKYYESKACKMVACFDSKFKSMPAGIRAQLLNTKTLELVQDFVVEQTESSIHVLNAVSPAFTCSFAFAKYIADKIEIIKKEMR